MTGPAPARSSGVKSRDPLLLAALALLPLAGCVEEPAASASGAARAEAPHSAPSGADWPVGTVVAVDDVPISLDEVDRASVWIERIQPEVAGRQLRRLALTNVSLLRALAEAIAPEERLAARSAAEAELERLRARANEAPTPDEGLGKRVEGNWQVLGIPLWGEALDWPPGEWHLIEEPGRFVVARRVARSDQPHPAATSLEVDTVVHPYLPPELDLDAAMEDHRLTIVDPEWREIVPERTQYRMGVHAATAIETPSESGPEVEEDRP